jgi:hypothetical protein
MRSRLPKPLVLFAILLTFLVAGCGSSGSSDKKANDAYANSVCTAIANWGKEVKSIATDFSGGLSKASLQAKVSNIDSATKTLVNDLKAIPKPNSSAGQATKQQLDQLATDLSNTVDAIKTGIDEITANASVTTVRSVASAVAPQVKTLATTVESTLKSLENTAEPLASSFESASACKSLGNNLGGGG